MREKMNPFIENKKSGKSSPPTQQPNRPRGRTHKNPGYHSLATSNDLAGKTLPAKKPAIRSDCESNGSQSLYSRKSFATHSPVQHTTTAQWIFGIGKRRSKSEVHYQGPHGSDANLDPQPLLLTAGATSNSIH